MKFSQLLKEHDYRDISIRPKGILSDTTHRPPVCSLAEPFERNISLTTVRILINLYTKVGHNM